MDCIKLFFEPASIAVIGASNTARSAGSIIMDSLLPGRHIRKIYPVNPHKNKLFDMECFPSIASLPEVPDLLILATPAGTIPPLIEEGGRKGIKAAIIISAGFRETGEQGKSLEREIVRSAEKYGMRIIGPNCMGVIRPVNCLNTTFSRIDVKPGGIAFISQSGALGMAVLDWAVSRGVGFSAFVSLGSMLDVDFGDMVDYFSRDPQTSSIIIYLESLGNELKNARKFISAAQSVASEKPVILLKPGKYPESRKAAASHTGSLLSEDSYYDAAFNRAGMVRVSSISDLFNCAAILNTVKLPRKPDLAIISNSGGLAILATDALLNCAGKLAELKPETYAELNKFLSPYWSKANPLDILGDSTAKMYGDSLRLVLADPGVHGVLVLSTPQSVEKLKAIAREIISVSSTSEKPVLTAVIGSRDVAEARQLFYQNGIPVYEFPEEAIRTYMYMYQYRRGLEMFKEMPYELSSDTVISREMLKSLVKEAIDNKQVILSDANSEKLLSAYGLSVTKSYIAGDQDQAIRIALDMGLPVIMKIVSPDISCQPDASKLIARVNSVRELINAYSEIMSVAKRSIPEASIAGVSLRRMVKNPDYELVVRTEQDLMLGDIIMFGPGGVEAEFYHDINVGLPPLNRILAHRLLEDKDTFKSLLHGYRAGLRVNMQTIEEILVNVSRLITDFPEIKELDISPLFIKDDKATVVSIRIILDTEPLSDDSGKYDHMIIAPYPVTYARDWSFK
jgi:acetyltransferase